MPACARLDSIGDNVAARVLKADARPNRPMTVSVPALDIAIRPEHYQRLAEKIAGKPEERIVSYLMLRSLKQARYAADPLGHFALAFDQYTHFTSPIRRLSRPHRPPSSEWALDPFPRHALAAPPCNRGQKQMTGDVLVPIAAANWKLIAERKLSETERRAETAERELMAWEDSAVHGTAFGRGV